MKILTTFLTFTLLTSALIVPAAFAAPKADLWDVWAKHDPNSTATIDHGAWQAFLDKYVTPGPTGIHLVDYAGVDAAGKKALDGYLAALQATPISSYNRDEQRAFWINFYNALTVKVILDHWPVDSITDIDISGFLKNGPWDAELAKVEGHEISLNDIEHRILRPIWKDNRLHYAVNCASIGCPNLAQRAYTAENTDELLEQGAHDYVNHPRGAHFKDGRLVVSSIYDWYQVDFGDSDEGVIQHLRKYAEGELAKQLEGYDGRVSDDYDWNVNAVSR